MGAALQALELDKVSKRYRLGKIGSGTLSGDLQRYWQLMRGGEDPHLPLGSEAGSGSIWALKDVSLKVAQGEVLGLIGKNGAGKSTLLKLLSRVTIPSSGRICLRGQLSSLLEVGTGMHPELSGRENIFLNGAILGMSRSDIAARFDDMVDFSGCATFIDTPVKRYSSGMKVRLGFSVAAFLEPDIMVVDEVLAVGDAAFQKQAIARMQEVSSRGGRTVIFVSHNMASVRSLCTRAVWLDAGQIRLQGAVEKCISEYLGYASAPGRRSYDWHRDDAPQCPELRLCKARLSSPGKGDSAALSTDEDLLVQVVVEARQELDHLDCTLQVHSETGIFIAASSSMMQSKGGAIRAGESMEFLCRIPAHFFNQGVYRLGLLLVRDKNKTCLRLDDLFQISLATAPRARDSWMGTPASLLLPNFDWKSQKS